MISGDIFRVVSVLLLHQEKYIQARGREEGTWAAVGKAWEGRFVFTSENVKVIIVLLEIKHNFAAEIWPMMYRERVKLRHPLYYIQ